jgi:hypothetical protein
MGVVTPTQRRGAGEYCQVSDKLLRPVTNHSITPIMTHQVAVLSLTSTGDRFTRIDGNDTEKELNKIDVSRCSTSDSWASGRRPQGKHESGIERVATEARPVDRQTSGQGVWNDQPQLDAP